MPVAYDVSFYKPAPGDWVKHGACRPYPRSWWFPERGINLVQNGEANNTLRQAINICNTCVVKQQCLNYALMTPRERYGVWGGTTEKDRRGMRAVSNVRVRIQERVLS